MKIFKILILLISLSSCSKNKKINNEIIKPDLQKIIDSNNVNGSILIYDLKRDSFFSNNFDWAKIGRLPASTFKIPNSIIALENKIIENDSTILKWNGEKRTYKVWEQDLTFKNAFHFSCVPCYQNIAEKIGVKRMNNYLEKLKYKQMNVNSENLNVFWLEGDSKINQFQQIDFLKRFFNSELEISKRTEKIMKRMISIENTEQNKLSGKTGLSIRNGNYNGWFVGYLEANKNVYFFATNIEPKENSNKKGFPKLRKKITIEALKIME